MKKNIVKVFALILALSLCFTFTGCEFLNNLLNPKPTLSTEVYEGDVIYVGNTAGTTGALAAIGGPFNLGIEAAFAKYNAAGGFNGKTVALKHYDDGGIGADAATLTEKLIHEDGVFAVVGNFGSYAVSTNLNILKQNCVPMIYAAAGNEVLFNDNAVDDSDRSIFPVQPLNKTEGRALILRAFAPALDANFQLTGGLGGTKVGVISNSNEASQSMLAGIKAEAANLPEALRNNIVYQNVATDDPSAAINALKDAGCDVVIVTVIGADWTTAVKKMVDAGCTWSVLTSYNNASAGAFNDTPIEIAGTTYNLMSATYAQALATMKIYSQGWINIVDTNVLYNPAAAYQYTGALLPFYTALGQAPNGYVAGFTADYWVVAEALYNYAVASGKSVTEAFMMSYDAYALAGYVAGDLFCQALDALKASGKDLTRANLVEVMESNEFQIAMAGKISFANGMRAGVDSFSLTTFYATKGMAASTSVTNGVNSLDELRALLGQ
jgi:ABC-type branched-subunit amino acid transport system substrate-binding protein